MSPIEWQKSSYSSGEGSNCLYVAITPGGTIGLRESDDPDVIVTTTPTGFRSLIATIKTGEFDQFTD
ncbi:DUF397 domain-containing protein [Actinacidiphila oryziradicis]|uniref:DUF397 domain-containing protein n=1 Tax=Actinacidiphila oryziradicis TaxID=2571141 RepID=A0A4U0T849_9ACTN|nr:DUF397 domain-containing protein [Actinacidiphila oryziradicis]TKA10065.1 DUF397 domain-containing protein [Actinacidiphila oryziradicis]